MVKAQLPPPCLVIGAEPGAGLALLGHRFSVPVEKMRFRRVRPPTRIGVKR
jgi:hypothetical protein